MGNQQRGNTGTKIAKALRDFLLFLFYFTRLGKKVVPKVSGTARKAIKKKKEKKNNEEKEKKEQLKDERIEKHEQRIEELLEKLGIPLNKDQTVNVTAHTGRMAQKTQQNNTPRAAPSKKS